LVKQERQQVLRASAELKSQYPQLWHTDQLYNALLPRSLQEQGIVSNPAEPLTAAARQKLQERQQSWLTAYGRLRKWVDTLPPDIFQISQGKMAARVRTTGRHDIESMVVLPEREEVVLVGRRRNARQERTSPYREGHIYSLKDGASCWRGRLVPMPLEWQKPTRLMSPLQGGVFASFVEAFDMDDIFTTHLWQSNGEAVEQIDWLAGARFDESTVCFRQDASRIQCVVYGRKLGEVGTRGLYWYSLKSLVQGDSRLHLHVDGFTSLADCSFKVVNMALSAHGHSAILVSQNGDIIISPMPNRGRAQTWIPAQTLDFQGGFKDAVTSPGTNVLVMRDASGGLLAWKKHRSSGRILWRLPQASPSSSASKLPITDYRLSPDGHRVGVLRGGTLLEIWSLAASHKPVSRFCLGQAPIVHFDFSPYSHALLAATPKRTFVVLPTTPKPLKIPVPHVGATGRFMPGMLRIVGHVDSTLWDLDLGTAPPN
jgi:hypothetical protein